MLRQNPGLHLDAVATDKLVDIVEEGFDAGVLYYPSRRYVSAGLQALIGLLQA